MKIIIVGASGTIGKRIVESLRNEHEIISVGSKSGDIHADISSVESIENLFRQTGSFDALICAAGNAYFGPWNTMADNEFRVGINHKLMGQINLVLIGQRYISANGSFTLTSGLLSSNPVPAGSNASTVNGAVNSFVIASANELADGIRINAVSPGLVEDSTDYYAYFPGFVPVTMQRVVAGYQQSLLGSVTGKIIEVH